MSISTIDREHTRPPIALTARGMTSHVATTLGLWLLHWAKRSDIAGATRVERRRARIERQARFDRMLETVAERQLDVQSSVAVLRSLR